ncbi:MAG TPA: DinB family protein [Bacteroidota bacterium]|nr:DinB family protein [Bacteroidota bacterium]
MIRKIEDFVKLWEYETESTLKLFNCITDETLNKEVKGYERTLGFLAWHIILSNVEMGNNTGLSIEGPKPDTDPPNKVSEIIEIFKKTSESLLNEVKSKWNDDSLLEKKEMYGEMWENGATLHIIISHLTHHRAQMTVLMRILGLPVVGVYGPSKEEWKNFGMEPQK